MAPSVHRLDQTAFRLPKPVRAWLQGQAESEAQIVISAADEQAAREFAETFLRQGVMRRTIVTAVETA